MIGRLALWLVLAACAVLVMLVQADRQAYRDPTVIALTPPATRVVARQRLAEVRLLTGRADEAALADVRRLVQMRPAPAHNLLLYAQTAQLAGNEDAVLPPLQVAIGRGWREPTLQLLAGQAALAEGDYPATVNRLAALLATGAAPDQRQQLLRAVLTDERGRAELAALAGRPGHYLRFLWRRLAEAGTPAQVLDVARRAEAAGNKPECAPLQDVATGWQQQGGAEEAAALLALDCSAGS